MNLKNFVHANIVIDELNDLEEKFRRFFEQLSLDDLKMKIRLQVVKMDIVGSGKFT